jgi:hypothetical protein
MKVALPLRFAFFFFLQGAEETNTFYLITPRSQELCERIGFADEGWIALLVGGCC